MDGRPPKRTETAKGSYQPKWNEDLTLLVTPYSKLLFRVYDRSSFKKDSLIGEHTVDLYSMLRKHEGQITDVTVSLDLKGAPNKRHSSHGSQANGTAAANQEKVGELVLKFDGLRIDMDALAAASGGQGGAAAAGVPLVGVSAAAAAVAGTECNGNVPSPGASPTTSSSTAADPSVRPRHVRGLSNGHATPTGRAKLPSLPKEVSGSSRRSSGASSAQGRMTGKILAYIFFVLLTLGHNQHKVG